MRETNLKLIHLRDTLGMLRHFAIVPIAAIFVTLAGAGVARALPSGVAPDGGAAIDPALLCQAAVIMAESDKHTPAGLLRAIGTVESGRPDRVTGQLAPWPWTIDANGSGHMYQTEAEAIAAAQSFLQQGITSLDIGCMQVNIREHPHAFASLAQAFDPMSNVFYAAGFLTRLKLQTGNWEQAIAAYHSATPSLGAPYANQVLARWLGQGGGQTGGQTGLPLVQTAMTQPLPMAAKSASAPHVWGPANPPAPPVTTATGAAKRAVTQGKPSPGGINVRHFAPGSFAFAPLHGTASILPLQGQPASAGPHVNVQGSMGGGMAGRSLAAYRRMPIPITGAPS